MLTADEGHFLTEREDVPILKRTVASVVAVGRNDSPEEWVEISAEEAEEWKRKYNEARKLEEETMLLNESENADN